MARRRSVQGVASLTVLVGLLTRAAWTVCGLVIADLALVAGNLSVAVGLAVLVALLARADHAPGGQLLAEAVAVLAGCCGCGGDVSAGSSRARGCVGGTGQPASDAARPRRSPPPRRRFSSDVLADRRGLRLLAVYGLAVGDLVISAPHILLLPTALITAILAGTTARQATGGA
jgi:hypothetical protein